MCSARASAGTISLPCPPLCPFASFSTLYTRCLALLASRVSRLASRVSPLVFVVVSRNASPSDEIILIRQVHQFGIEKVKSCRIERSRYDLRSSRLLFVSRLRRVLLRCPALHQSLCPANSVRVTRFRFAKRAVLLASAQRIQHLRLIESRSTRTKAAG